MGEDAPADSAEQKGSCEFLGTDHSYGVKGLAAEPGFEPGLRDSESRVLPLHHSAYPVN